MSDNFRVERIKKLLQELEYEVKRGLMECEIEEEMSYQFIFPRSRRLSNGVVQCVFFMQPTRDYPVYEQPYLKIVVDKEEEG